MPNERAKPRDLSAGQLEALKEVAGYEGQAGIFWWRQASMKALAERGYVEAYRPSFVSPRRAKRLPHRITAAGKAQLAAIRAIDLTKPVEG